jgi:hypothetical protein
LFTNSDGTTTINRSEWDLAYLGSSYGYQHNVLNIKNLPITSLDLGGHDGITTLNVQSCSNLTTINTVGCENLMDIEYKDNSVLVSSNLQQLTYLRSIKMDNLSNCSQVLLPNNLKSLSIYNVGLTSLDLSTQTSLIELYLTNLLQIDNSAITSLHNNNYLKNTLSNFIFENINCPYINLTEFVKLEQVTFKNLSITSINLPNSVKTIKFENLPNMSPTSIDSLIINADSGSVTNGMLYRGGNGSLRTSASDAAVTSLQSKGWVLYRIDKV